MSNPSLLCVPYRFKTSKLYSQIPDSGLGDFTVTRSASNSATRVNAAGLIETVADNVPRLDYPIGGIAAGCPALLVEPSGTNSFQRSNELNIGSPWTQDNISFTTGSTSAFTSPDGTTNAFLLADTSSNTRHRISQQPTTSFVSGTTYTVSIFVKKNSSGRFLLLNANTAFGARAALNLDTLAITNIDGSGASVENYGNGWYRFLIRGTATSTQATSVFIQMQNAATDLPYIGNGSSFYLFGAQLETGSIATSYIPTVASPVTRGAETISKTGVSSLIGQTEGTLYVDINRRDNSTPNRRILSIGTGSNFDNRIEIVCGGTGNANKITCAMATSGVTQFSQQSSADFLGDVKAALSYSSAGFSFYVNGNIIASGTTAITPPIVNSIGLGQIWNTAILSNVAFNDRIRAVELYPTRLPNTGPLSLQSLTQ